MKKFLSVFLSLAIIFCCVSVAMGSASAESSVRLYSMYQSDMLFQRDKPVVLKGFAPAGANITAELYSGSTVIRTASAASGADGKFTVAFDGVAGGYDEYTLVMKSSNTEFARLTGVVFGELWLSNGQSNMQLDLRLTPDGAEKLNRGLTDKYMRAFLEPVLPTANGKNTDYNEVEMTETEGAIWYKGDNTNALTSMSAVAFFFAERLREELDMPVGILSVSIGGSSIRAWLSAGAIDASGMRQYAGYPGREDNTVAGRGLYDVSRAFNVKVAPLRVFSIAGMIWYQGESDMAEPEGRYADYLNLLRKDYSTQFGFNGNTMPLIYSHIAPYYYGSDLDALGSFAKDLTIAFEREPQYMSQITIYDLPLYYDFSAYTGGAGGSHPIHPITKSPVGYRMADAANKLVYGAKGAYTSPILLSSRVDGKYVYATLSYVGDGLMKNGAELYGCAVCGKDGKYVEAKAEIVSGDKIRIWSDYVSEPVAATYGYSLVNNYNNLFSSEGGRALLAAVPFRTETLDNAVYYQNKDWLSCDYAKSFHYTGKIDDYYDTWEISSADGYRAKTSFDNKDKFSGESSLRIDFKTFTQLNKAFTLSPVLTGYDDDYIKKSFEDVQTDYSGYDVLTFRVKNTSGRDIKLNELKIISNDGVEYAPAIWNTASVGTVIKSSDEWQTITLDLAKLYVCGDVNGYAVNGREALKNVKNFSFKLEDTAALGKSGTLHFDAFEFGNVGTVQNSNVNRNVSLLLARLMKAVNTVFGFQSDIFYKIIGLINGK